MLGVAHKITSIVKLIPKKSVAKDCGRFVGRSRQRNIYSIIVGIPIPKISILSYIENSSSMKYMNIPIINMYNPI